ncbi:MAG: DnaJ domain-containing protein [Bryobacterales bacterium]|nr:DnaJ domain-containing protein [Bryobacterales bacterium]
MAARTVNYYDELQIHPKAEPETIHRVYRLFAARYHPDNRASGNAETFRRIREAYETLSDPQSRAAYDAELAKLEPPPLPVFQSGEFGNGIASEGKIRLGILCLLYARRRANPDYAALSMLDLEHLMAFPREHLSFSVWYLRAKRYLAQDDRSSFVITAEGVDFLESQLADNEFLLRVFRESENGMMLFPRALITSKERH